MLRKLPPIRTFNSVPSVSFSRISPSSPDSLLFGGRLKTIRLAVTWVVYNTIRTAAVSVLGLLQPITEDSNGFHHVSDSSIHVVVALDKLENSKLLRIGALFWAGSLLSKNLFMLFLALFGISGD